MSFFMICKGKMNFVAANGKNTWDDNGEGQGYVVEKIDYKQVQELQELIDSLIQHQPKAK
jgi:hypothetical protein